MVAAHPTKAGRAPALVRVSLADLQSGEVSVQVEKNDATKLLLIVTRHTFSSAPTKTPGKADSNGICVPLPSEA